MSMIAWLVTFLPLGICCLTEIAEDSSAPPGGISLLPGYTHQRSKGIDTAVGQFVRRDGLTIGYDIGASAGNYALVRKKNATWFKQHEINRRLVQVCKKDMELTVTFPDSSANFFAKVEKDEDMAEVLLIVLSYAPPTNK